jgi:hypothetical protein
MEGHCTCGAVRFRLEREPMFTLACHCTWCQRETGAAFSLLTLIERSAITPLSGRVEEVTVPSPSGQGQVVRRCALCKVALWSRYGAAGPGMAFVRVGVLDRPGAFAPQVHCYTSTKQSWLVLDGSVPVEPEWIDDAKYWSADSLARQNRLQDLGAAG